MRPVLAGIVAALLLGAPIGGYLFVRGMAADASETKPVKPRPTARPEKRISYESCDIFNGQKTTCHGWFHGLAVIEKDGSYQSCDVFNGQVQFCHGWFQGRTVLWKDGAWQECDVFNGQPGFCHGWYQGSAVIPVEE